jgi:hypothetical protein
MGLRCDVMRLLSMLRDIYLQKKKPGVSLVSSESVAAMNSFASFRSCCRAGVHAFVRFLTRTYIDRMCV